MTIKEILAIDKASEDKEIQETENLARIIDVKIEKEEEREDKDNQEDKIAIMIESQNREEREILETRENLKEKKKEDLKEEKKEDPREETIEEEMRGETTIEEMTEETMTEMTEDTEEEISNSIEITDLQEIMTETLIEKKILTFLDLQGGLTNKREKKIEIEELLLFGQRLLILDQLTIISISMQRYIQFDLGGFSAKSWK